MSEPADNVLRISFKGPQIAEILNLLDRLCGERKVSLNRITDDPVRALREEIDLMQIEANQVRWAISKVVFGPEPLPPDQYEWKLRQLIGSHESA